MSETTPIESYQHELNKDNERYTKVDGGRVRVDYRPQPYRKNYEKLKVGGNSLPQGRVHQLVIQFQMVSPENTHTTNIIMTEKVIFRNI